MRITYVARSFLDYRVPVLAELNQISCGQLSFITSDKWTPERALNRLKSVLGDHAIRLSGEQSLGTDVPVEANTSVCLPYQPGLLRAIDSTRPDVLVGDGFFQWTYAGLLHRLRSGTPLVICYERWAHTERRAQWYRRCYRRCALKLTDAVCCNGQLSAEYTRSLGFPTERVTTGHMAADNERLATQAEAVDTGARAKLRAVLKARGVLFLYVGQLIKRKGLDHLLEAWARFEKQNEGTLAIVGAGPEAGNLLEQARHLGLRHVCFVGSVDYEQLPAYYAAADVFIIPTLEDNWSLVVPEAMACGLPILCSKYNGCWPELIKTGLNGWIFDPLDLNETRRCLETCLRHSGELPFMGRASKAILRDHTPRLAAEAIFKTCQMATQVRHGWKNLGYLTEAQGSREL